MSVAAELAIAFYSFPGFTDPALPEGMWAGSHAVTGDASGGTRIVDLIFSLAGAPISPRMYSLEQVSSFDELVVSPGSITIEDIALGLAGTLPIQSLFASLNRNSVVTFSSPRTVDLKSLSGTWLGRVNRSTVNAVLRLTAVNSDGDDLGFTAQGYFWGARSLNVPGGPRRPASGMFS